MIENMKPTVDTAMTFLSNVALALPPQYSPLVNILFADPKFSQGPGGLSLHHAYLGGLALHTAEVVYNCFTITGADLFVDSGDNPRIAYPGIMHFNAIIVAAMLHDYCKVFEYEYDVEFVEAEGQQDLPDEFSRVMVTTIKPGTIKGTNYRKTIGHVTGSAMIFHMNAVQLGLEYDFTMDVLHIMLSHHGRAEWRSPVEPKTPEAWVLHAADMLSAYPL